MMIVRFFRQRENPEKKKKTIVTGSFMINFVCEKIGKSPFLIDFLTHFRVQASDIFSYE